MRPRLLRDSLRHFLERENGLRVIGELSFPHGLFEAIDESSPEIVVQAFEGHEREHAQALCRQLLACFPEISVISVDLARELVSLSSAARACVTRPFLGIRGLIAAIRLWSDTGESPWRALAGASAEQFADSRR